MLKTISLAHNGDAYEIVVDTATHQVKEIWRYRGQQRVKPEFMRYEWLDEMLRDKVDDVVMRVYGNGN